nr:WD40-like Beta Propeller Repeat [uncultured bacterium]
MLRAPEIGNLRWSPDGSELLLWARGSGKNGIYTVSSRGGAARLVLPGLFTACWSPDGASIAIATYLTGEIHVVGSRGVARRTLQLRGDHWSILDMDWSAAGDRLLLASSDRRGRHALSIIDADGRNQREITSAPVEIPSARWMPQANGIYYLRRVNQTMSLYRIPDDPAAAAAAAPGRAILSGLESDGRFTLSADANRLVYSRSQYFSNLSVLDAETGTTRPLTQGTALVERPRVSPDDTTVVFNAGHDPLSNLYTIPITGGSPKQLTFLGSLTVGGVWSDDGRTIAFASTERGRSRIWTVPAEGGSPRPVSTGDLSSNLDVAWSPGSRMLYQQAGNRNYYEVDPRTAAERLLVPAGAPGWMFGPVYSPDGRKIAVMWNRPAHPGIWIIDRRDGSERLLYPSAGRSVRTIGWSADDVYIAEGTIGEARGATSFVGETMREATILRISVRTGEAVRVRSIPASEVGSISMTRDGRRFVYPAFSDRSDVWIVDGFDAAITARR